MVWMGACIQGIGRSARVARTPAPRWRLCPAIARECSTLAPTPAPPLQLVYDSSTTSLFLFSDVCYATAFSSFGCPLDLLDDCMTIAHRRICSDMRLLHRKAQYWPTPWSVPAYMYNPEMPPSMEPLEACQIRSIEAVGCVSSFELGMIPDFVEFVIDKRVQAEAAQRLSEEYKDMIWWNRVSTGNILLAVPTKAVKYKALEWIVSYEDYRGMPMVLSVRKFIQGCAANKEDPVKELEAADAVGIRKCVVVDLRGIGVNRKVGLFFAQDALRDLSGKCFAKVPATEIFDDNLWRKLGVQGTAKDAECDVVDFGGVMEIMLLKPEPHSQIVGPCDSVLSSNTTPTGMCKEERPVASPSNIVRKAGLLHFVRDYSTAAVRSPSGQGVIHWPCSNPTCSDFSFSLCSNDPCSVNEFISWASHTAMRIFLEQYVPSGQTLHGYLQQLSKDISFARSVNATLSNFQAHQILSNVNSQTVVDIAGGVSVPFHPTIKNARAGIADFLALYHHYAPTRNLARILGLYTRVGDLTIVWPSKIADEYQLYFVGAIAAIKFIADQRNLKVVCTDVKGDVIVR